MIYVSKDLDLWNHLSKSDYGHRVPVYLTFVSSEVLSVDISTHTRFLVYQSPPTRPIGTKSISGLDNPS